MPILMRYGESSEVLDSREFVTEEALEMVLSSHPDLLRQQGESALAFVDRQVELGEAGTLDLLFVNADGLPVAVEVKLQRNAQARREVVAQAIDYLSALTARTVDELDDLVDGKLEDALRSFSDEDDEAAFDRRWRAVGANLRAGLARLVLALDAAPSSLDRIVRFLAQNSSLDVQLITVHQYVTGKKAEVLVPHFSVSAQSVDKPGGPPTTKAPRPELLAVVEKYNSNAPGHLWAVGSGANYRQIRPPDWPTSFRTHYEFYQTSSQIGAELHIETDAGKPLTAILSPLAGRLVAGNATALTWDAGWSSGRGRLMAKFPPSEDPSVVAKAMEDLIALTHVSVRDKLIELAGANRPKT